MATSPHPVFACSAPGHRLGHSILEIGESLVHWDFEPEVALATRGTILIELAESGSTVATNHFASPGRIERAGDGLRGSCSCRPVQYACQLERQDVAIRAKTSWDV